MRKITLALVGTALALTGFAAGTANAEASASVFISKIDEGNEWYKLALASYSNAFLWANTQVIKDKGTPLFCQPAKLALAVEQDVSILKNYVKGNPETGDSPVGLVFIEVARQNWTVR